MDPEDRALTAFAMLGHATVHAYELVIPVFVAVWLDAFATTPAVLGAVVGASYACTGIGALPAGLLADRVSARRLVLGCMAGMGGGFLVVAAAPGVGVLAAGLLAWGAAASVYHPAGLSLLSRATTDRELAFAYHGMAGNVGVAIGPLLAVVLLSVLGWRAVAAALVIPAALAVAAGSRLEFEGDADATATVEGSEGVVSSSARLFAAGFLPVFAIAGLYGLYYRGAFTFLPDVLAGLPALSPTSIAGRTLEPGMYVYSGLLLLGGAGQYSGGRLVRRYRAEAVLAWSFAALTAVALLFVPAAGAGPGPLIAVAGSLGFLAFLVAPVNQEVVSRHVPADLRGLSFGWVYVAVFGVGALGSVGGGVVLTRASPGVLFALLAGTAVLAAALALALDRSGTGTSGA